MFLNPGCPLESFKIDANTRPHPRLNHTNSLKGGGQGIDFSHGHLGLRNTEMQKKKKKKLKTQMEYLRMGLLKEWEIAS